MQFIALVKEMLLFNGWVLIGKALLFLVLIKGDGLLFFMSRVWEAKLKVGGWVWSGENVFKLRGVLMSQGNSEKFGWGPDKSLMNLFLILISTENGVSSTL